MSSGRVVKWFAVAGAGFVLSGCVAPPPGAYGPVAYNDGYAQPAPVYSEEPVYYYDTYDAAPRIYYEPVYPAVSTSFVYRNYDRGDYRRDRRADRRERGDRRREALRNRADGERVRRDLTVEERRQLRQERRTLRQERRAERRARREADAANRRDATNRAVLLLRNQPEREGQRASDGN